FGARPAGRRFVFHKILRRSSLHPVKIKGFFATALHEGGLTRREYKCRLNLSECEACPQGAAFSFPPIIGAPDNFV
ncbi:hypothetical protein AAC610_14950, partial [Neisseria gonorrhoeae]